MDRVTEAFSKKKRDVLRQIAKEVTPEGNLTPLGKDMLAELEPGLQKTTLSQGGIREKIVLPAFNVALKHSQSARNLISSLPPEPL